MKYPKSPIHQMYCTHCTFGTSALERREGDIGERVLGYSARASSMDREELRKNYRQVERNLYYSLPSDSPPEEKLRLDAALAPRRFVFFPSIGGLQVVGQVFYRQKDTSRTERVGSYFGHLLLSDRAAKPWSVVECLKLWGGPWVIEDSPDLPFDLPPFEKLESFVGGKRPAIDDAVLVSFLSSPPGKPFDDPQGVIPKRWSNVTRTERVAILTELLRAYLDQGTGRRESVLVVAEPSVAALLFYAVARLLPAGKFRDEISFSTFEPDPDRLNTSLAATTFYDPENADLKPEIYRRAGYAINTFRKKSSVTQPKLKGSYARLMVEKLAAEGMAAVDGLLAAFEAASPQRPEDLEALAEAHNLLPALLDPERPIAEWQWRDSPLASAFLSQLVRRTLVAEPPGSPRLKAIAAGPNAMMLLELISTQGNGEDAGAAKSLLRYLPEQRFPALLNSDRIAIGHKADVLAGYIHKTRHFPENCPQLWNGGGKGAKPKENGANGPRLLSAVLARLDLNTLQKVQALVPPSHSAAYLIGLVQAAKLDPSKQPLSVHVVTAMDDSQLARFLGGYGEELRPYYPKREHHLAKRLARFLDELPQRPAQMPERLGMLKAWSDFFDESQNAKERLSAWDRLLRDVHSLKSISGNGGQGTQTPTWTQYDAVGKRMAAALQEAMPVERYGGHDHAARKLNLLRELGRTIVGREDFLPDVVWTAMREVFHGGLWNLSAAASAMNTFSVNEDWKATAPADEDEDEQAGLWARLKASPLFPVIGAVTCLAILAIVVLIALMINFNREPTDNAPEGETPQTVQYDRDGNPERVHARPRMDELERQMYGRGRRVEQSDAEVPPDPPPPQQEPPPVEHQPNP